MRCGRRSRMRGINGKYNIHRYTLLAGKPESLQGKNKQKYFTYKPKNSKKLFESLKRQKSGEATISRQE